MDDVLTELLGHLGMKVMKQADAFALVGKNNDEVVECYVKQPHTTIGWTFPKYHDCKELVNALLNEIELFYIYYTSAIVNPYNGCKSLEEAMIKKDLNPEVKNLLNDSKLHNTIHIL